MGAAGIGEVEFVSKQSEVSPSSTGSALQPGGPQPVGQPGKAGFLLPPPDTKSSVRKETDVNDWQQNIKEKNLQKPSR